MRYGLAVATVVIGLLSPVAADAGGSYPYPSPAETAANIMNTVNAFIEDGDNKTLEETKEKTSEVKEITKDSSIDIEGFFVVVFIMFGPFILAYAIGYPIAVYSDHRTLVWREEEAWLKRRGGEPLNAKREILYPFIFGRSITEISETVGKSRWFVIRTIIGGTLRELIKTTNEKEIK